MSTTAVPTTVPTGATPTPTKNGKNGAGHVARRPIQPPPQAPSREAKQRAAAILEVLAGARTPSDAARALAVTVPRYYLLEERGLAGLLSACEPRPRGRSNDAGRRCQELERECERWQRECARQQALVRAAQRGIGLPAPAPLPAKQAGKKQRKRKPTVRALHVAARLRQEEESASPVVVPDGPIVSTQPAVSG